MFFITLKVPVRGKKDPAERDMALEMSYNEMSYNVRKH
jgi:hypothetical protein